MRAADVLIQIALLPVTLAIAGTLMVRRGLDSDQRVVVRPVMPIRGTPATP